VEGRLLAFNLRHGRTREKLYLFTTFDLPAEQISAMYDFRWNIETDLRSLKREVRIHMLEAKSPAMAEKELVLSVAAYNLTRAAMNTAGRALNLDPRQFSFSQAQDTMNAYLPVFANARSEAERQQIVEQMLRVFTQSKLPRRRKRRSYPRAVWPRPCSFPKRKVNKKC
jgi:transposase